MVLAECKLLWWFLENQVAIAYLTNDLKIINKHLALELEQTTLSKKD